MGLTSTIFSEPIFPLASRARPCRSHFNLSCSASLSTTRNPTLCLVSSYSLPGLPRPMINFMVELLTTIGQARCQVAWQTSLDDLLLCYLEWIGNAIKGNLLLLGIVDHERRARITIAWLTHTAGIHDGAISLRRLPFPLGRIEHLIRHIDHTLAQAQQR